MRTLQQSSHPGTSWVSILLTLSLIILFSSSQKILAQQKNGDEANSSSNSNAPSGRVNFNILSLMNGEYLEAYGANNSRGILRGHPTIPGLELGTTTADPLIFSTSSAERMRILSNGFTGIGTTNPTTPFEVHFPDATAYSAGIASNSRMRFVNNNTTNNNAVELNLSTFDTAGTLATGVRLVGIFTNHTAGATAADFAMVLRNGGNWFEVARFAAGGNVGIGTNAPAYKLDVAGPVRSTSGGFIFPDGTVQTTAGGGGGGGSQWVTSGTSIYYNGGNVGLGTSAPGVALEVAQNRAIRVGQATLSSGGDYANFSNHGWYNGTAWQVDGLAGAIYNLNGAQHTWYTHNTAGVTTPLMQLGADGSLGIGTQSPSSRLHVNGGSIRLAATAGETPFQLYSYANSSSLWLASGNPSTSEIHLSPGYAVDFDRSLAVQYTPGSTGATAGILKIGQLNKNNANWTHGVTALFTNGTERLRINSTGNVGIGTASPAFKLDVAGQIRSSSGGIVFPDGTVQTTAGGGSSQWTTSGANIYYNVGGGNVGVGTANPLGRFHVNGVSPGSWGTAVFSGTQWSTHINYNIDNSEDTYIRGGKTTSRVVINDQNSGPVLALGTGNFGIGTPTPTEKLEVVGNIKVSGNINAKYQDMAEWVESSQTPPAGTVVILDSSKANNVIASTQSYDSRVAGVISRQPGLTLGEPAEGRVLVATTGRVKVKVDATNAPIQIGDLLVTSDREGFAMKSLPVEIGSARLHRPGTLIGKALEPLPSGTGEILVLLSLQ
jgi:hypothetical protein